MRIKHKTKAVLRALGVVSAVMVVASGVTFAALQSQDATLQGNSMTSATANLLIGNGDGQFGASASGFTFANVEPGGIAMPAAGNKLHIRNSGSTDLTLRLTINPNVLHNPDNVDLSKVFMVVSEENGNNEQQYALSTLQNAYTTHTPVATPFMLPAGQEAAYLLKMQLSPTAVNGTSQGVSIYGIDLILSGRTQTP